MPPPPPPPPQQATPATAKQAIEEENRLRTLKIVQSISKSQQMVSTISRRKINGYSNNMQEENVVEGYNLALKALQKQNLELNILRDTTADHREKLQKYQQSIGDDLKHGKSALAAIAEGFDSGTSKFASAFELHRQEQLESLLLLEIGGVSVSASASASVSASAPPTSVDDIETTSSKSKESSKRQSKGKGKGKSKGSTQINTTSSSNSSRASHLTPPPFPPTSRVGAQLGMSHDGTAGERAKRVSLEEDDNTSHY